MGRLHVCSTPKRDVGGNFLRTRSVVRAAKVKVPMHKFILFLALSVANAHAGISRLEALSMIESGDDDSAIGQAGEVSRYQIKPSVWHRYSASESYADQRTAGRVAGQHLTGLETTFRKATRRQAGPFDLYVMWNAGPAYYARRGFASARVHPVIRERAKRYAHLCRENPPAQLAIRRPVAQPAAAVKQSPPEIVSALKSEPIWPVHSVVLPVSFERSLLPVPLGASEPMTSGGQPVFALGGVR